ncbi:hypothetical protein FRX31_008104 [Thalictrum thalictroides]|uniref:Uncharacterized protein n=1 Tax=Thalictrum thalictroides TaxID=46969 RepID=A0A7J6X0Q7_THATH|nr:hypothetical protein FRX31_008104 [Thalictrum thalictroides]
MKFLSEFGCCFFPSELSSEIPITTTTAAPYTQDTQLPVTLPPVAETDVSPVEQLSRSRSTPVSQWKPSLSAIHEDKDVFVLPRAHTVRPGGTVAQKSQPKAKKKPLHNNTYKYRQSQSGNSTVLPGFAPIFLF